MKISRFVSMILAVVFVFTMAACCGHDTDVKQTEIINQPTIGQQLDDLDKAYKYGSITKEEYDKVRKTILDKATAEPQKK